MKTYLTTWTDGHELWVRAESPADATAAALLITASGHRTLIGVHERATAPSLEWSQACGHKYQVGRW